MAYQKKELLLHDGDVREYIMSHLGDDTIYAEDQDGDDVEAFCDNACEVSAENAVYLTFDTGQRFKLVVSLDGGEEAPK